MDEPKPLDSLFKEKLFRIPDYQRGYAWGREQLDAFWEDLINLPDGRSPLYRRADSEGDSVRRHSAG